MSDSAHRPLTLQEFLRRLWVVRLQEIEDLRSEVNMLRRQIILHDDPARQCLQELGYTVEF